MTDGRLAPVALFVFNRPQLTAKVYEQIRAARPSRLLLVADGPRPGRPEDIELCRITRELVSSPDWPCEVLTNFSAENLGSGRRVSSGLDWVFEHCPEAIILEDDCIPCPSFFEFCTEMLDRYRDDARIMHVSGNNFQNGRRRGDGSYFFSRYSLSWGWATWRRAWRLYDPRLSLWPTARKERWLDTWLDNPAEAKYWKGIFDRRYRGKEEFFGWDYQWLFTCWCQHGLSIQPNENLVSNVGFGPDATRFKQGHSTLGIPTCDLGECVHPTEIVRDSQADRFTFEEHIAPRRDEGSWLIRLKRSLALRTRVKRLVGRSLAYRQQ